ncbi:hypothetical protein TNCV_285491 [Trichonephila clavipes]|nr:hypothetical protein TNCV_285491 [Trichonephila clavipes]
MASDTTYLHLLKLVMGCRRALCTRGFCFGRPLGLSDPLNTYSVCARRVFGGIGHRTLALRSGIRCSNRLATHGTVLGI